MSSLGIALLAVVAVVAVLPLASSQRVSYLCGENYYTSCGWFGWSRCARYRTKICYRYNPVHGGWTGYRAWSPYSTCTRPCGGGTQQRTGTRSCTNPTPAHGGNWCSGSPIGRQSRTCNTHRCPVHGVWTGYGAWSPYNTCTRTCGGGVQERTRTRTCTKPAPAYGGRNCTGSAIGKETRTCNNHFCPVDGGWTDWEEWQDMDDCTVLCGGGGKKDQERSRTCTKPAPAYGGADCDGKNYQNQTIDCGEEGCGSRCPEGKGNYLTHTTNNRRFYQCSNGVALRHDCPDGTVFDPDLEVCNHAPKPSHAPKPADSCPAQGVVMMADGSDCTKFVHCVHGTPYEQRCPASTRFDVDKQLCVHNNGEC